MERLKNHLVDQYSLLEKWKLRSNKTIPYDESKLKPGDTVMVTPIMGGIPFLYHHGVYVGDRNVVHTQTEGIVRWDLEKFCENRTKVLIRPLIPLPHELNKPKLMDKRRELVVDTAESMVGHEWKFNAISENCESFTNWITTGRMYSQQGNVVRNTVCLTGAYLVGYIIGRGRRIRVR